MQKRPLAISDVVEIVPTRHADSRGYFSETFRADWFSANIAPVAFVQSNQSLSRAAGVVRGLHMQRRPAAQGKLVQCLQGSLFDVAVDVRTGSATFGRWVAVELSAASGNQLWIPAGFLHGFCTLVPDTVVAYQVTSTYDPQQEDGVAWNDPDLAIAWPAIADPSSPSPRDQRLPSLRDFTPDAVD